MVRVTMGIIKDRLGTYYVQRKVPPRLQEAVARVLNADEPRRVHLKKSLGTKILKEAKAAAPHIVADFNRIIGEAEALLKEQPVVTALTDAQIKRMAESFYASVLAKDEEERREGTGLRAQTQRPPMTPQTARNDSGVVLRVLRGWVAPNTRTHQ